jgi:hypothetical protein
LIISIVDDLTFAVDELAKDVEICQKWSVLIIYHNIRQPSNSTIYLLKYRGCTNYHVSMVISLVNNIRNCVNIG